MARIPAGGGGGGAASGGWIKITGLTAPGGTVTSKVYQDAPHNTILQSATVSELGVEIEVRAAYPFVSIGATTYTLDQSPDGGHYYGTLACTIPGDGPIAVVCRTANNEPGAVDAVDLTYNAAPQILTLSFAGIYPGMQVELKAGDTFALEGTTNKLADAIEILDFGACVQNVQTFVAGTTFSIVGTIADRGNAIQILPARCRARDAVTAAYGPPRSTNALGGTVDGVDVVNCNNLHPTAVWGVVAYPPAQQALKAAESATVPIAIANATTVLFDSPTSEVQVVNPTVNEPVKTIQRISGTYNIATPNVRVTCNRVLNNATTVATVQVRIAAVAAQLAIGLPASRLRSGGNNSTAVQNHAIQVIANQQLLGEPTLTIPLGGGSWNGGWSGGPNVWTRLISIHDDLAKGTYTWLGILGVNLSGIQTTILSGTTNYILGGFVARNLQFSPYQQATPFGSQVVDYGKIQAGIFTATNQPAVRHSPQGDQGDATDEYTILSPLGANPQLLWWNDAYAAGSNSSGTAMITAVEEVV